MSKVQIVYFGKPALVDVDQVDLLTQKEAAVNAMVLIDKTLNTNGGCVDMNKIKKLQSKILLLNRKIRQNVQFL
jgi:hypothetical protein